MGALATLRSAVASRFGFVPAMDHARTATELTRTQQQLHEVSTTALGLMQQRMRSQASGVDINAGRFYIEQNERLRGHQRWDALEEIRLDPHVKGSFRFNILPLVAYTDWKFEAGSDKPADKEAAELLDSNLLGKPSDRYGREYGLATSWRQRLYEILDGMLGDGFSMFAKSTRVVPAKGKVGPRRVYDRISWLEPSSVDPNGWELDDEDNIKRIRRTYRLPSGAQRFREPLTPQQISLFPWELKGARYEGVPFTRPMWWPYSCKLQLQRWGMAYAQRSASGAPFGWYPPDTPADVVAAFTSAVQQCRGQSPTDLYFVGPMSADGKPGDVKFASADGEIDRFGDFIQRQNEELSHAGGTKAMILGETEQGSRALAEPISEIEIMFLGAIAMAVCEFTNVGVANLEGEAWPLSAWNIRGVSEPPRLTFGRVHPAQGLAHMAGVYQGIGAKVIPLVPELRRQVTEMYGFKLPDEAYEIEPEPEPEPEPVTQPGAGEGDQAVDEDEPADLDEQETEEQDATALAADLAGIRTSIAPYLEPDHQGRPAPSQRRRPNRLESLFVNLAAVQSGFDQGEQHAVRDLRRARASMIAEIGRRIASGKISPRNVESQGRSRARNAGALVASLRKALETVAGEGREHVQSELRRMRESRQRRVA